MQSNCLMCDGKVAPNATTDERCEKCAQFKQPEIFKRSLEILCNFSVKQTDFDEVDRRCRQLQCLIDRCPIYPTILKQFDLDHHDKDKVAMSYLRERLPKMDIEIYKNYFPIEIENYGNENSLLKTIMFLCSIEGEDNYLELRVRNIVDMIINAETYIKMHPVLNDLQNTKATWQRWIIDNAREAFWVRFFKILC